MSGGKVRLTLLKGHSVGPRRGTAKVRCGVVQTSRGNQQHRGGSQGNSGEQQGWGSVAPYDGHA